jgi:hypothetical protein
MGGRRPRGVMPQRTALFDRHRALGARIVDFAGWEMPVSYRGALDEHRAVRERCGLFDVSHMGEIELRGRGALACCDRLTVNAVAPGFIETDMVSGMPEAAVNQVKAMTPLRRLFLLVLDSLRFR